MAKALSSIGKRTISRITNRPIAPEIVSDVSTIVKGIETRKAGKKVYPKGAFAYNRFPKIPTDRAKIMFWSFFLKKFSIERKLSKAEAKALHKIVSLVKVIQIPRSERMIVFPSAGLGMLELVKAVGKIRAQEILLEWAHEQHNILNFAEKHQADFGIGQTIQIRGIIGFANCVGSKQKMKRYLEGETTLIREQLDKIKRGNAIPPGALKKVHGFLTRRRENIAELFEELYEKNSQGTG